MHVKPRLVAKERQCRGVKVLEDIMARGVSLLLDVWRVTKDHEKENKKTA